MLSSLGARLTARLRVVMAEYERSLRGLASGLDAMSPLKVLARGYAIATTEDGRAVRDASDVSVGERLELRVARGRIAATVTEAHAPESNGRREPDAAESNGRREPVAR